MGGRPLCVRWTHTANELAERLDEESDPRRRERLRALLMVRQGASLRETSAVLALNYRSLQRWIALYRASGLEAVLHRVPGHASPGRPAKLTPVQTRDLLWCDEAGQFDSIVDARDWVADHYGVEYSYAGIHRLLRGRHTGPVPGHRRGE